MKLLSKFALLLSLLGLSVIISLVFAAWSVQTVSREVSSAYSDLTFILEQLDRVKQTAEHSLAAINREFDNPERSGGFEAWPITDQTKPILTDLTDAPGFARRVGESTSELVVSLAENCCEAIERYQHALIAAGSGPIDPELRTEAQAKFEAMHSLIERVQAQLLRDVDLSLNYGRDLRGTLMRVIGASLALSILVACLALILVRRWVLAPISELRQATSEIAAGNLDYRLQVRSADEFGQLSGEVNHMAEMVVAAQQRLIDRERLAAIGELVRRLAHNLRNPLAGIRGLAELTREELPRDSELAENQTRIVTAVDRFEKWLADLLHSTTPMTLKPESIESAELCRSLEASHVPMARAKRVSLHIEHEGWPAQLMIDPVQMEHALVALISNAIEAAPEGGTVRLRAAMDEGSCVEIRVEDSGAGVDPTATGRIFVPHFTTKRHGTGIGLAVVHNVITSHGGRIRVERSSDLGGAAFIVTLPNRAGK